MYPDECDEWHLQEEDCSLPQVNWLETCATIAYGTSFTKKDLLEYNRIFEGME